MFKNARNLQWVLSLLFGLLVLALLSVPSWADSDISATQAAVEDDAEGIATSSVDGESESEAWGSTQSTDAVSAKDYGKLQVHGFLTQAWATADFANPPVGPLVEGGTGPVAPSPSVSELSLGIPENGTSKYRFLALQFRYDISPKDVFVVQLSSRELGFSPIQNLEDEIELDWAFYERKIGDLTSLKVGRVQIPYGIYNEVRDVGTILPFYRPAFIIYREAAFTSETVDGLSISHTFFSDSDWSLDASTYYGEWEAVQVDLAALDVVGRIDAEDGIGYQLWLNTPISGLRIGTSLISFKQVGGPISIPDRRSLYLGSLDLSLDRFTLQAELEVENVEFAIPGTPNQEVTGKGSYILTGFKASDKFSLWAQFEHYDFDFDWPGLLVDGAFNALSRNDLGVAVNYYFAPNLVLKAEYHWTKEGYLQFFPTSPFFFPAQVVESTADDGRYSILSLSVSF